jgi:hypothetical protein
MNKPPLNVSVLPYTDPGSTENERVPNKLISPEPVPGDISSKTPYVRAVLARCRGIRIMLAAAIAGRHDEWKPARVPKRIKKDNE